MWLRVVSRGQAKGGQVMIEAIGNVAIAVAISLAIAFVMARLYER